MTKMKNVNQFWATKTLSEQKRKQQQQQQQQNNPKNKTIYSKEINSQKTKVSGLSKLDISEILIHINIKSENEWTRCISLWTKRC